MPLSLEEIGSRLREGALLDRTEALALSSHPDQDGLHRLADEIRCHFHGRRFHLCSIINARSGNCSEDCRFCAQSARHRTTVVRYRVIDADQALEQARDNDRYGVDRLSLVTSGRDLDRAGLEAMAGLYDRIRRHTSLRFCASMGLLGAGRLTRLRNLGVDRYHCNLESNLSRFAAVCTSHSYQDKVRTLEQARRQGFSLCSGGIVGMGESMADRIDLALELRDLGVLSIPINILTPIPGTPLAHHPVPSLEEILTTVALFRLLNPRAVIRMAGGRQQLADTQYRCFAAGANGAIVGNYLTTTGSGISNDLERLTAMGYIFARRI